MPELSDRLAKCMSDAWYETTITHDKPVSYDLCLLYAQLKRAIFLEFKWDPEFNAMEFVEKVGAYDG